MRDRASVEGPQEPGQPLVDRIRRIVFVAIAVLAFTAVTFAIVGPSGSSGLTRSIPMRLLELAIAACAVAGLLVPRPTDRSGRFGRKHRYAAAAAAAIVCLVFVGFGKHWSDTGRMMAGPLAVDLLEILVAPLVVVALITIARPRDSGFGILRVAIDGAVIASSTVVFGWYVAVRPLRDGGTSFDVSPSTALAFLVVDALAFAFGLLLLSRVRYSGRPIVIFGVLGLGVLLIADIARVVQVLPNDPGSSALSELGWVASLCCFAIAAWLPQRTGRAPTSGAASGSPWWIALAYTFLLPVAAVLVIASYRDDGDPLMGISAAAIIAVLGFRHVLVRHRNEVLTSQLQRSVQQLARRARHDELTGLLNRGGLVDELEALQREGRNRTEPVAAIFVDLDRFKGVNDALGHSVGDTVLRVIGTRIGGWVDEVGGIAARIAGDEFIVVLPGVRSETAALSRAQDVLDLVEAPVPVGPRGELIVTASAGVAVSTDIGTDDAIIRHADLAMLEAKSGGRARVQLFEEDLRQRSEDRMQIEQELRRAVATDHEIEVHLQPLARLDTVGEELWGAEALVRWRHPTRGVLYPPRFLSVAEDSGLIVPVGERVLALAAAAAAAIPGMVVTVNLSPRQLHDPALGPIVRRQLRRQGLDPGRLCLEVTEAALVDDRAISVLEDLRRFGVQVAIDDFGVGASSFRQLRRLPGALVKIDRSFIERIDEESGADDRVMVKAMVGLAQQLGLQVIAEGIERESQLEIVRELGVTIGQGWHLGAPIRAAVFVTERGGGVMLQPRRH